MKLSVTIITYNEEKNIQACIESVLDVADEIIVVDSFSKDKTAEICQAFSKVKFMENPFSGHVEQKNFAISQSNHEFVLSLDADERLSEKLKEEILEWKNNENPVTDAFSMPRLNNYCGKWIRHSGWYPDRKVRLWNKNKGKWGGSNPHDKVILNENSNSQNLKGQILHYTYQNTTQHDEQIEKFTSIAAQESFRKNKKVFILPHLILYPFYSFIKVYFVKLGILDGYYGLVLSLKHSRYKYLKYFKLYQLKKGANS
ncbi:glycosyltransferase family 2 protein [Marivirga sp.]|uniref:glycosyltransferase family 2 protein n=1 Tax=Marivirga sp. TaxID=2018662 RepID=UPI002D807E3A|nr:glycosyltransferase family 2 protein [Marivirga sp.]HET8859510.1 glycosyltransferase family 2 protein [Marivirga sp.]